MGRVSGIRPPAHRGGAYAPAGSWTRRRPIGRNYAAAGMQPSTSSGESNAENRKWLRAQGIRQRIETAPSGIGIRLRA